MFNDIDIPDHVKQATLITVGIFAGGAVAVLLLSRLAPRRDPSVSWQASAGRLADRSRYPVKYAKRR